MPRLSKITIVATGLIALSVLALGVIGWGTSDMPEDTTALLPGLEMQKVETGDYNLTILVPDSFGRKYYSKPARIDRPYYISRYEITIDQWNKCVNDGGCSEPAKMRKYQTGNHPVTLVSWYYAFSFTQWLSKTTGDAYRLPTEEEWAYAAFAGEDVTRDTIDDLIRNRQMIQTATLSRFRKTSAIGANGENIWSIADMTGSVWEWTADVLVFIGRRKQETMDHRRTEQS